MPKPVIVDGAGKGCPAVSFSDWLQFKCATIKFFDGRIRVYDEIMIPIIGILVLVGVWILLKKTRIGMVIRAGVQDRQMVEALGINVRRIFTFVFALGVGLAAFGGVLAGPSAGLTTGMGDTLLTAALIALAIGGSPVSRGQPWGRCWWAWYSNSSSSMGKLVFIFPSAISSLNPRRHWYRLPPYS